MSTWSRAILHVDLDAFYASVEQLRRPETRGKPVVVGGGADSQGAAVTTRGVVSAASYEARRFGVRSAMPLSRALRLCPTAIVVPVDFPAYRAASSQVFACFQQLTPLVEPLSLDEAYLDLTASLSVIGDPVPVARRLQELVFEKTQLQASVGVATSKTLAKIASDLEKPRGFVVVPPGTEAAFLAPLPVRTMPGLGPATESALQGLGVDTLGRLAALPLEVVMRRLGDHSGRSLWQRAHGVDDSEVAVPRDPKSISREETFSRDVSDRTRLHTRLDELAADVASRSRHSKLRGRTVNLRLRRADFTDLSRQMSLATPTDSTTAIAAAARQLFDAAWDGSPVRLLGVGLSQFTTTAQLDLFASPRDERLDRALDGIRERFGPTAARRGTGDGLRDLDLRGEDLRRLAPESVESED